MQCQREVGLSFLRQEDFKQICYTLRFENQEKKLYQGMRSSVEFILITQDSTLRVLRISPSIMSVVLQVVAQNQTVSMPSIRPISGVRAHAT